MKLLGLLIAFLATVVSGTQLLLPLYIYPGNNAWANVYDAIARYPTVQFIIVVNINSGPVTGPSIPPDWSTALGNLARYANVKTLGYVYTKYGRRSMSSVQADIATYAGWPSGIAVDGIFFDEAASSSSSTQVNYMSTAASYARSRISGAMVLFNMGYTPATTSYYNFCDGIVVFEGSYSQYYGLSPLDQSVASGFSSKSSFVVHDFDESSSTLRNEIRAIKAKGLHSAYFTGSSDYDSIAAPAAIGDVAKAIATA